MLEILAQHPLMSPEQLGVPLASHPNVIRKELKGLQEKNLVTRINPRSPDISPRALFYLTTKNRNYFQRVAHLWLVIERVYGVRNLCLRIRLPFQVTHWDVECNARFAYRNHPRRATLHGAGLAHLDHNTIPFVIEWDTGIREYERARMARLIEWHHALRAYGVPRNPIPFVLLVVAQDAHRLQAYYATLRAVTLARNLPTPLIFYATARDVINNSITAPIWYSTDGKNKQPLFANLRPTTKANSFTHLNIQRRTTADKNVANLVDAEFDLSKPTSSASLAALKRDLSPQTKRVLNEVAAHPLLAALEIATLLDDLSGQVHRALKQLTQLNLLQAFQMQIETRYLLSEVGIHYLAATNGFGRAVNTYRKARGWKRSLFQLVRHWEHTQIENELFLELASVARERHARFEWRSETESRLYYAAQGRRWSFVPDGMCIYTDEKKRLRIAVEIERHRASKKRLRTKFNWYAMYLEATLYRTAREEEFRLLVVTMSWQRAKTIRRVVYELARLRGSALLPIWITTFDLLNECGIEKPIWRKVDTWERATCI